ncbi:MAG: ATP-binding protein [Pseudomonadota bacterium]|nr:ATP-binding protein [Pseudomonadota bacterium]
MISLLFTVLLAFGSGIVIIHQLTRRYHVLTSKTYAELTQAKRQLESIFAHPLLAIGLLDDKQRIIKINPKFASITVPQQGVCTQAIPFERYRQQLMNGHNITFEHAFYPYPESPLCCQIYGKAVNPKQLDEGILWILNDITAHKQTEETLTQREQHLAMLVEIQKILLSDQPLTTLYSTILSILGQKGHFEQIFLFINNPEEPLSATLHAQWTRADLEVFTPPQEWQVHLERMEPYWLDALQRSDGPILVSTQEVIHAAERQFLESLGIVSLMMFPLMTPPQFWGFMTFNHYSGHYSGDMLEIDILWTVVTSLALYHQRQQTERAIQATNQMLKQRVDELAVLNHITQAIISINDLPTLLTTIAQHLTLLFNAQSTWIALLDGEQFNICFDSHDYKMIRPIHLIVSRAQFPLATEVLAHQQPLVVTSAAIEQWINTLDQLLPTKNIQGLMCLPLISHGQAKGVMLVTTLHAQAFSPAEVTLAQTIAGQLTAAIDNAWLFEQEQQQRQVAEQQSQALVTANAELQTTLEHLRATQQELIFSEKMAALGQLVASVAHEINTPLGAIRSSVEHIAAFMNESFKQLPDFFQALSDSERHTFLALLEHSTLQKSLSSKEKRQLRRQLQQQLSVYEVNDPQTLADMLVDMGYYNDIKDILPVLTTAAHEQLLKLAYQITSVESSIQTIQIAIERASKVVFALKTFARHDMQGHKIQADIIEGIETVLTLYYNQLKQGVEVIRDYASIPMIDCYADELNQVWINLVQNALHAMEYQGQLTIQVKLQQHYLRVNITDSGPGIPQTVRENMFQPFFTTKPPGEGSGLGLDIVKKIIEKHQGKITFTSEIGQGTTFSVWLPLNVADS